MLSLDSKSPLLSGFSMFIAYTKNASFTNTKIDHFLCLAEKMPIFHLSIILIKWVLAIMLPI